MEINKKEMKGVRNKKLKHAMKIHEGRMFTETCLRERGEPIEGRGETKNQTLLTTHNNPQLG